MKELIEAMAEAAAYKYGAAGPCCDWDYEEIVRAALSAALERGYRLVPVEPTEEMVAKGGEGIDGNVDYDRDDLTISEEDALAAYRAMIAASPGVK